MAASCPAGPAFEGGLVTYGMPGVDGAIESLRLSNGQADYSTIGDGEPRGLCGSGLIDLLAELRRGGQMTPKGVFPNKAQELDIVPEYGITLSRLDASNLAQAKAANYCGQFIVMRNYGVRPADITKLYLAGGFANYVNVRNAIEIGFLAPVPEDRIVKIGNAAALGAKEMLLSRSKRQSTEKLAQQIEHVELETTPDFFEIFVEGCQFKPMPARLRFLGRGLKGKRREPVSTATSHDPANGSLEQAARCATCSNAPARPSPPVVGAGQLARRHHRAAADSKVMSAGPRPRRPCPGSTP